ncbi:MAG: DUF2723 domain-containing protein [Candidatus Promineifilaceae bacterium]
MTAYTPDKELHVGKEGHALPYWQRLRDLRLPQLLYEQATLSTAAFMLPFLLYLLTLAPTIYNLDSAELSTAASTGGIVRATGYPLYLLLGRIWSLIPVGDVGYRMNLLSAVCGALTIFLTWHILARLEVNVWARAGALGLLATAPYFWALSLIAEVYTLHTVLMAAVILLMLRWYERPTLLGLIPAVFLLALSMGNHAATILLAPACLFLVLVRAPRLALHPKTWLASGTALIAGMSIYLYLPLLYTTNPAFNYAGIYNAAGEFLTVDLTTPSGLWWLISGKAFSGQMFAYKLNELWPEISNFGIQLWISFFAVGVGPGLFGIVKLLRRNWRLGLFLILLFLANAIFYINYRVIDKNTMFLPAFLVWAVWVAIGYQDLLAWVVKTSPAAVEDQRIKNLGRFVMVAVVVMALGWNWQRVNLAHDTSARERGEAILQAAEPNAILLGWWDTVPVVEYLQLVEGQRPDVQAINRFLISGPDMETLIRQEIGSRPIYISSPPVSLLSTIDAVPVGPVYKLQPRLPQKEVQNSIENK